MSTLRSDLQQRAQKSIVQYAIFRWESAVVLVLAIVLFVLVRRPVPWWPRFGWLLLGLIAFGVVVYSSLTDADTNARLLLHLFREKFDPRKIGDEALRSDVEEALEYQRRIEIQVRKQPPGQIRERLELTANQIADWISNLYLLARQLDSYRQDELLARERELLPREIEQLAAQRRLEADGAVRTQLDDVIESKERHWRTLQALDLRMRHGALQLEQSLTALGTVYSQIQLIDARGIDSGRAERVQADIEEEVVRLNDLLSSINQVYDYSGQGLKK